MAVNTATTFEAFVITLPFSFTQTGSVRRTSHTDGAVWKARVKTILTTNDYERIWYKYYGAALQNILFSPEDLSNLNVRSAVNEAFVRWLPDLSLEDMTAIYDGDNGYLEFNITYSLPTGEQDSVKITTAELTAAGETVKVISNG